MEASSSRSPTAHSPLPATRTTRAPWQPRPRSISSRRRARAMSSRPRRASCGAAGATASTRSSSPTSGASALRSLADAPTAWTVKSWGGVTSMQLQSFVAGKWLAGTGGGVALRDATTGEVIASATADGLDTRLMLEHAREVGGGNLRRLTFHERAALLKALARYLTEHKEELYTLSYATGATKGDSWIDIDGGIGTLFVYASKGMRS